MAWSKRKRRASRRKRPYKKRSRKPALPPLRTKVRKNTTKLNRVARIVDATTSTHTKRVFSVVSLNSVFGQQKSYEVKAFYRTQLEGALEKLSWFDPNIPNSLEQIDGTLGDYERKYRFTKLTAWMEIRNNGYTPAIIKTYKCTPKVDTSVAPLAAWEDSMQNQIVLPTTNEIANLCSRPSDGEFFQSLWDTSGYMKKTLYPGESHTTTMSLDPFDYHPANADTHALEYIKGQAAVWLITLCGQSATDTTDQWRSASDTDNVILSVGGTAVVEYSGGGVGLRTLEYVIPSFSTGAKAYMSSKAVFAQDTDGKYPPGAYENA